MAKAKRLPLAASGFFLLAAVLGGLGGLAAVGFRRGLELLQELLMGQGGSIVTAGASLSTEMRIAVPAIGGFAAGLILWLLGRRHTPFGISDVMDMVGHRKSHIAPLRSGAQIVSSACSLGSGGSLGREGAITQISTTLASLFGGVFRKGSRNRVILLACGTAAGMASSYNAPLAGAVFVMEVILGSFAMEIFAPLVVASVGSAVVTRLAGGDVTLYESHVALTGGLVFLALVLGLLCGAGGVVFNHAMRYGKRLFSFVPGPPVVSLTLGGALVGVIAVWYPQVWGNGQEVIADEILTNKAIGLVFALVVLKIVATAITTGSGALGGVFTPTLVVGAALGAFYALALQKLGLAVNREALVLVGMAGICAAATHAPVTSIFLVFELTRDYEIMLPVMLCSISASVVARTLHGESYYTARQRAKGAHAASGLEDLALRGNLVHDIMRADATSVLETTSFDDVMTLFSTTRRDTLYVVGDQGRLIGRIYIHDIKYFLNDTSLQSVVIAAELMRNPVTATRDETLAGIIDRFDDPDLGEIAVVGDLEHQRLIGRVTRRDLMACLSDEVLGQRKLRTRFRRQEDTEDIHVQLPPQTVLDKLVVSSNYAGRTIGSLQLPDEVVPVIVVFHGADGVESRRVAGPALELASRSELIVLGPAAAVAELAAEFRQG